MGRVNVRNERLVKLFDHSAHRIESGIQVNRRKNGLECIGKC